MKSDNQKLSEYQECREFLRLSEPESLLQEIRIIKSLSKSNCNYNGVDQNGVDWKARSQQYFEENKKLQGRINYLEDLHGNNVLEKSSMGTEIVKLTKEADAANLSHLNTISSLKKDYDERIEKLQGIINKNQLSCLSKFAWLKQINDLTDELKHRKENNETLILHCNGLDKELESLKKDIQSYCDNLGVWDNKELPGRFVALFGYLCKDKKLSVSMTGKEFLEPQRPQQWVKEEERKCIEQIQNDLRKFAKTWARPGLEIVFEDKPSEIHPFIKYYDQPKNIAAKNKAITEAYDLLKKGVDILHSQMNKQKFEKKLCDEVKELSPEERWLKYGI